MTNNHVWTGPTKAEEGMHPDLEWLARNVSEWLGTKYATFESDGDVLWTNKPFNTGDSYTRSQWLQARQLLGLEQQFCSYPDCNCPMDKTEVCGKGLPTEEEEEAFQRMQAMQETGISQEEADRLYKMAESIPQGVVTEKQRRYQDDGGEDWIDEAARTFKPEEFRGAMRFTIGKYNRRMGKKDELIKEIEKMRDYCERWLEYERGRL